MWEPSHSKQDLQVLTPFHKEIFYSNATLNQSLRKSKKKEGKKEGLSYINKLSVFSALKPR